MYRPNLRRRRRARGVLKFDCEKTDQQLTVLTGGCHDDNSPTRLDGRPASTTWFQQQQNPSDNIVPPRSFSSSSRRRSLQDDIFGSDNSDSSGQPFAIVIMVIILVCLAYMTMCIQRRCKRRREMEQQERLRRLHRRALEEEVDSGNNGVTGVVGRSRLMLGYDGDSAAAEFIRTSIRNFNLHETAAAAAAASATTPTAASPAIGAGLSYNFSIQSMSLEDRKEYLENLLICKRIIEILDGGAETEKVNGGEEGRQDIGDDDEKKGTNSSKTIQVLFGDEVDMDETSNATIAETCPICLVEYREGDALVWSQSEKCSHMFHKHCMVEWLLQNEECPLCRQNYLSLSDDDHYQDEDQNNEQQGRRNVLSQQVEAAPSYRNHVYLQHRNHSLATPHASMLPSSSSSYRRQREELFADRDQSTYMSSVELIQLLQSLQRLSDTQQNATVRLDGIELAYPNRRPRQTLHETRTRYSIPPQGRTASVPVLSNAQGESQVEDESNESNSNDTETSASPPSAVNLNDVESASGHESANDRDHYPPEPQQASIENLEIDNGDGRDEES